MSDKPSEKSEPANVDRRSFLKVVGAAGALPLATAPAVAAMSGDMKNMDMADAATPAAAPAASTTPTPAATPTGYQFFNTNESAFIESLVDTLIPHDDTGPGALELGANIYIDRQMAGAYGKGDRLFLAGPYAQGTPQQGWQLAFVPSEFVRAGIADVDAYAQASQGDFFSSLSADKRIAVLKDVESGKATLATVPAAAWFGEVLELTLEGYLGDPLYGGNKGKAAWTMIGFPGADAMYMDKIEPFRNKPYTFEAKSIQDLI
jgi:gluconate 2-dehydrogenase gamma chain